MRVHALLAAALLLLGAGQPQPPQQQQPQPPPQQPPVQQQRPPVIRSGINFVSVDAIVTDKKTGDVVLDMTQSDFEVREDKKPQTIQTFDVVKIDPLTAPAQPPRAITSTYDEETAAKEPNTRLFILFLDDYHVRRGSDLFVRGPLVDFVQNQLASQDMVAVMYPLTPVSALTFTRNRSSLIAAINGFLGRKNDYIPRNQFEEQYANYPAVQVEQIRNEVSITALEGAAIKLGTMREGRKSIIYVSEGFTANLPAQLADPIASLPGFGNPSQPGRDVSTPMTQAQNFFNQTDLMGRLKDVFDTCNRNNTSIYAVDPRGLAGSEYDINQGVSLTTDRQDLNSTIDTLYTLANNTDGRAIVNRNDLAAGMKQIMRDASGYYLLGYTSSAAPTDGRFHTIDVKVKRPGVEVRFRKGYWAYTSEEASRAKEGSGKVGPPPSVSHALSNVVESTKTGHSARFWTGTDRAADGKTRVTFVWEPLVSGDNARASDIPARVMVTALAADGHPLYRGRVPDASTPAVPDLAPGPTGGTASTPAATAAPAGGAVTFSAAAGPVELRLSVENEHGQVIDATTESLTLPDYGTAGVSFSTPKVYRARTAREMMLLRNNLDAPPIATREFNRAERLLIRVDAYAPGAAKPEVTAKLLNRDGHPMADVPVQAADGKPFQIDLPLASLAPGEYVVELDAKAASGTAQQMIGFKIGA